MICDCVAYANFTSYRPYYTEYSSSSSNTNQDDNGYYTSNVYWFEYEPIMWRILTEENGEAMLLCEMRIDSQAYQNFYTSYNGDCYAVDYDGNTLTDAYGNNVYANNYAYSTIRAWLNENFYNTAFNNLQKEIIQITTVDNSAASTTDADGNLTQATEYVCEDTNDRIFLLSEEEVTTSEYGFASFSTYDTARRKKTTDYAQCQGAYTYSSTGSYAGNGWWWLRSPYYNYGYLARGVRDGGYAGGDVNYTGGGVCPALWITL